LAGAIRRGFHCNRGPAASCDGFNPFDDADGDDPFDDVLRGLFAQQFQSARERRRNHEATTAKATFEAEAKRRQEGAAAEKANAAAAAAATTERLKAAMENKQLEELRQVLEECEGKGVRHPPSALSLLSVLLSALFSFLLSSLLLLPFLFPSLLPSLLPSPRSHLCSPLISALSESASLASRGRSASLWPTPLTDAGGTRGHS